MKNNKLVYDAVIETVKSEISDDPDSLKLASEIVGECVDVTGKMKSASFFAYDLKRKIIYLLS